VTERESLLIERLLQAVEDYRNPLTYRTTRAAPVRERLADLAAVKARRESALDAAIHDLKRECRL